MAGKSREKVNYADVVDLIETFQKEPEDPDCPFIVASELEELDGEWHLSIVLSSNTIIDRILHDPVAKSLQIDFTHGLSIGNNTVHLNFFLDFAANLDDLLVAMVGTPNSAHEYCPIAISITTGENTRSAVDILKWVRMNNQGQVQGVLADGARCLTLAIQKVFGELVDRIMCFYHMKKYDEEIYIFAANFNYQFLRNFRKTGAALLRSKDDELYQDLNSDLDCFARGVLDAEMWEVVTPLFFNKWQQVKPQGLNKDKKEALEKAVNYVKSTWFDDDGVRNWFQGAHPLGPITNNNLERNNGILKSKDYSNHTKLGFKELYELVSDFGHILISPLIYDSFSCVITLWSR